MVNSPVFAGPPDPMVETIATMREILKFSANYKPQTLIRYMELIGSKRLFTVHEEAALTRTWDTIRADSQLMDFVIETTRELFLRCQGLCESYMAWLAETLAESLLIFVDTASVIDKDALEQFNHTTIVQVYKGNPWLCAMIVASMSRIEEILMPEGVQIPAPPEA